MTPQPHFFPAGPPLFQVPGIVITLGAILVLVEVYRAGIPARLTFPLSDLHAAPGSERPARRDLGWVLLATAVATWTAFSFLSLVGATDSVALHLAQALLSVVNNVCFYMAAGYIDGVEWDEDRWYRKIGRTLGHSVMYGLFVGAACLTMMLGVIESPSWSRYLSIPGGVTSVAVLMVYLHDLARALRQRGTPVLVVAVTLTFAVQLFVEFQIATYPFLEPRASHPGIASWLTCTSFGGYDSVPPCQGTRGMPGGVETTWAASLTSRALFSVLLVVQAFSWVTDGARVLSGILSRVLADLQDTKAAVAAGELPNETALLLIQDDLNDALDDVRESIGAGEATPSEAAAIAAASAAEGAPFEPPDNRKWPREGDLLDWKYTKTVLYSHFPRLRVVDVHTYVGTKLNIDDDTVKKHILHMRRAGRGIRTRQEQRVFVVLTEFLDSKGLTYDLQRLIIRV